MKRRFPNRVWDRLFDLLASFDNDLTDEEVATILKLRGIDTSKSMERIKKLLLEKDQTVAKALELSSEAIEIPRDVVFADFKHNGSIFLDRLLKHTLYVIEAEVNLDHKICKILISGRYPRSTYYDKRYEFAPELVPNIRGYLNSRGKLVEALMLFRGRLDALYNETEERLL